MKKIVQITILLFCFTKASTQDLKSAYLQYKWASGGTYNFELKLYCDASQNIPRPTAPINFGDATFGNMVLTSNGTVNGVSIKTYTISHAYTAYGQYYPAYQDSFRISNIKNILNSQTQAIRSEAYINIGFLTGHNTAPFLQNHPIYFQKVGNTVCFDPNFYDVEGDSVSYFLANCCTVGYYIPAGTTLSNNGTVCFSKDSLGMYSFSYLLREYRKDANFNYYIIGHSQIDFVMNITNDVGMIESEGKNKFSLFPSPVSNILNINGELENSEIEILNTLGQSLKKVFSQNKIDVSELPAGSYFLKVNSDGVTSYSKFIKE